MFQENIYKKNKIYKILCVWELFCVWVSREKEDLSNLLEKINFLLKIYFVYS